MLQKRDKSGYRQDVPFQEFFPKTEKLINGEAIRQSIAVMHDRSNGLGGGFAGYGIYPAI